ncbi:MAG TPA: carboxypeptidase-like regulatory domain-containing protein [Methanocella sp.]|uniref:carboxypeptidase-like regulatory domain-containing protein n=1 Tax=Methanocella sp. TaxID=2052833 RepID=UPI002B794B77|nr:carboxypeptidase-like regulatory domain-containing protein [Methanocella sp.]HTY90032.1 carboxypeptidase-like regulatory domain-containing protein [Methanocella sp.]
MRLSAVAVAMLFVLATAPALAQEYGSITGIVTSANNAAVPGATVTLWAIEDGTPVFAVVPNNPQYTSNFSSSLPGAYAFTGVPPGTYNVTAEWNGSWFYTQVNLTSGTVTANIVIPVYVDVLSIRPPMAIPAPKTYYTFVPVRVSSPMPQPTTARSPGFEAIILLFGICIAAYTRARR